MAPPHGLWSKRRRETKSQEAALLLPQLTCRKLPGPCQAASKRENEEGKTRRRKAEVAHRKCPCPSSRGLLSCPSAALCRSTAGCPLTARARHTPTNAAGKKKKRAGGKQNGAPPSRCCRIVGRVAAWAAHRQRGPVLMGSPRERNASLPPAHRFCCSTALPAVTYRTNTATYQFSARREFCKFLSRQTLR